MRANRARLHIAGGGHSFRAVPHRAGHKEHRAGTTAQRIRIGLTGLAFAFLLVLLGSVVSRSGRDDNSAAVENAVTNAPKEPLAELGVAPGPEPEQPGKAGNSDNK